MRVFGPAASRPGSAGLELRIGTAGESSWRERKGPMRKNYKFVATMAAAVTVCAALAVGCTTQQAVDAPAKDNSTTPAASAPAEDSTKADAANAAAADANVEADGAKSELVYFKNTYPLQWESAHGTTERIDTVKGASEPEAYPTTHGHYQLNARMTGPLVRAEGPQVRNLVKSVDGYYQISDFDYDVETGQWVIEEGSLPLAYEPSQNQKGCYACKSASFDELWAENPGTDYMGASVDREFLDAMAGDVWGCTTCHADKNNMSQVDAQIDMFQIVGAPYYDQIDPKDRVCGQCHNEFGMYRKSTSNVEGEESPTPWRYGIDVDSLYQASVEDGKAAMDEEVGVEVLSSSHADVEIFMGSNHKSLGLTCTSCHMATITDEESGEQFTNHHASASPLNSEETLEFCLTCHKDQGIESTAAMKQMVRDLQAETADTIEANMAKEKQLRQAIIDAAAAGSVDDATLDEARTAYSKAIYYREHAEAAGSVPFENIHDGRKVVHDPAEVQSVLSRANTMMDDALASLS